MMSIVRIIIAIFAFTLLQTEVHTFSTTKDCVDDVVKLVKEKRKELLTEFFSSNKQTSESLLQICMYYVPHKVHKILHLVNRETCNTKIPTTSELEQSIYDMYVQLLTQLRIYEGHDIPNSFGRYNDHVVGMTTAFFDRTAHQVAGICLHKNADQID